MSELLQSDIATANAVQWWLEKEAGNSTFNQNKVLDKLDVLRQTLLDKADPKIGGHIKRMEGWLEHYPSIEEYPPQQKNELDSKVFFGALMFLSGNYRRQRFIQAKDQADYYRRKLDWDHPGGISIKAYFPPALERARSNATSKEDVVAAGHKAINTTENAFRVIYRNAPSDFGKQESESVDVIAGEQKSWLDFLSKALINPAARRGLDPIDVPILEPTTITHAKQTTLATEMAARRS